MKTKRSMGMNTSFKTAEQRTKEYGEGGARTFVLKNANAAEQGAANGNVPWILSQMYAPTPIVNTDHTRDEGGGMVPRLYVPAPSTGGAK